MCDIWKTTEIREITPADLDRQAADIEALQVRWVIFSGGEPLMHSSLFHLCARLRSMGIRITILSTGLLLEKYAAAIVEHVDEVIVSLDGPAEIHDRIRRVPSAFHRMSAGIQALLRIEPRFPVAARCTVQKANHASLGATVEAARAMGLRSISFLAADLASTAFNRPEGWPVERQDEVGLTAAEIAALERELDALPADGFVLESPEKLRRIARHFRAHLGAVDPAAPRCNAPWVSAVVESDGTVRPCFFHAPLGTLAEEPLARILTGPRAVEFRRTLNVAQNPICRRCVCSLYLPEPL
jgi:MoaA/NifB/PqqE/SkfB family radical SAM enzyme